MGIDNVKELLKLGFEGAKVVKISLADGKIGVEDAANLMLLVPHVGPAFEGIDQVIPELKDMDAAERQELLEFAAAELGDVVDEADQVARIEAALRVGVAINDLVKLI